MNELVVLEVQIMVNKQTEGNQQIIILRNINTIKFTSQNQLLWIKMVIPMNNNKII